MALPTPKKPSADSPLSLLNRTNDLNSTIATTTTTISFADNERANLEWLKLQNSLLIQRCAIQRSVTEVDAMQHEIRSVAFDSTSTAAYTITYVDILSTAISIVARALAVYFNICLACQYYNSGYINYFWLTTSCIILPMFVTTLIYANMCYQDGKFNKGYFRALQTLWIVFLSSFFFRYWNSLMYSIRCKQAELKGDKEDQIKFYKLTLREESDVAFIRLFECFLECAPQKILQITIVLDQYERIFDNQVFSICSSFASMAWCLAAYHRCNRYAQIDKAKVSLHGIVLLLCWHFCISVSRTLCIALAASVFPLWTIIACLGHAVSFGFVTFIIDRPKFAATSYLNFMFCQVLGIVYLFTYIPVKDAPTRRKYILYYIICSLENTACVLLFIFYVSTNYLYTSLDFLIYPLCAMAMGFYYIGIAFMLIYYLYFHPIITARKSKRIINNN